MKDVLDASHPPRPLAPGRLPEVRPNEIALMFSGGLDSTATALRLAEQHERVHLVTYRNGYGHFRHDRSRRRAQELRRAAGDKFTFTLISTKQAFEQIVVRSIGADYRRFGSGFVWCLGCKLAMHARSALFCLRRGLLTMADGSNSDTDEMVEQSLLSLSLIRFFYEDLGVDFGTPVYDDAREASRDALRGGGVRTGLTVLDRQLGIQPSCVAGALYYLPYLLLNKAVKHEEDRVAGFFEAKTELARSLVDGWLAQEGVTLQEVLASRSTDGVAASADP